MKSTNGASLIQKSLNQPSVSKSATTSRRLFLQRVAAISAAGAGGQLIAACSKNTANSDNTADSASGSPSLSAEPAGRLTSDHVGDRILIVVDLEGGNDGLSMVIPAGSDAYYDLRPDLAIDDVLEINDRIGLNPKLTRIAELGVTIVEGVGPTNGDMSHFAMASRWELGDVDGTHSLRTGFGGRLADVLTRSGNISPITGISLAGQTPFLYGKDASSISLVGLDDLWMLRPTEWEELLAYQESIASFGDGPVGDSYGQLLDLGRRMMSPEDSDIEASVDWDDPMITDGGSLGEQLWLASDLIQADLGAQVMYAQLDGFDTHEGHSWRHEELMAQLDAAVGGFYKRAEDLGFADRVVVATVSEFGRRVRENDGGLDHGAASSMLVLGPVADQVLGHPDDLTDLDEDGNIEVSVGLDQYLGSLAEEWLGIEASSVLPDKPSLLGLF